MSQTTVVSPYADYEFYTEVFYGNAIKEKDFKRLEARAEEQLDVMTFNRIKTMDEKYMSEDLALNIRKAVCAMAEVIGEGESIGLGISSESNDGYSVSFQATAKHEASNWMRDCACRYLAESGLLYRGGGKWHED